MTNLERFRAFVAAWERRDADAVTAAMAQGIVYANVGLSLSQGREEVRAFLAPFTAGAEQIEWVVHHAAEAEDGSVLTERTDRFLMGGKWLEIPVMGVFVFDADGLIAEWRDYFDVAAFQAQMAG